jgi:Domain of unknown function (DUF397)
MHRETVRFKKSRRSGVNGNCVEVSHTLRHIRDSKNFGGSLLGGVDVARLIESVRCDRLSPMSAARF